MFVMNAWYVAAWAADLSEQPTARRICDVPLVLYRTADGQAAALFDRCPHRAAPLSLGKVTAQGIECGYHGIVFDAKGTCVHIPGQRHIPSTAGIKSYRVVEQDAIVWVWMGDEAGADLALIPQYPYHNDPKNWPYKHGMMHVKGSYSLIVDNLMDLTHVAYVHDKTIGGEPEAHVSAKMDTQRTPNGVKFTRWLLDIKPSPTTNLMVQFKGNVDRWQEFEYIAPSLVKHYAGQVDTNTGAYDKGKRDGGFAIRFLHALTPETETSCNYFYSTANGFGQDDPVNTERLYSTTHVVFAEDKSIIEQQQERLTEFGEGSLIDIRSDTARVSMRRVLERMLKNDTAPTDGVNLSMANEPLAELNEDAR